MRAVIIRFLTFNPVNEHWGVIAGLCAVWLVLLTATCFSLRSQPLSLKAKLTWMAIIVAVPIVGMALYALWCLTRGDWSFLKPLLSKPAPLRSPNR